MSVNKVFSWDPFSVSSLFSIFQNANRDSLKVTFHLTCVISDLVYGASHLLQSWYLLALQQVGRLDVAPYWRSLDLQLQFRLRLLLYEQFLPQLLHYLFLKIRGQINFYSSRCELPFPFSLDGYFWTELNFTTTRMLSTQHVYNIM